MNRRSHFPTLIVLLLLLALPQAVSAAAAGQEEASSGRRAAVSGILRTGFGHLLQIFEEIVFPQGNQGQAGEGDLGPGMDPWG